MLDSLVRVSRRAGWAALCYRRRQEQATARETPRRQRRSGRGGQVRTTTRDRTLARGTSACFTTRAFSTIKTAGLSA
jgi:hypothetical protein